MDLIASEGGVGPEGTGRDSVDPLGRVVQVALAIYLMPVVVIVCAIGGASILIGRAGRLSARLDGDTERATPHRPHALSRPGEGSLRRAETARRARARR